MPVYVGDLLTASAATVTGKPTPTRTWQWLRGSTAISGATSSTYTVAEADLGANLSVRQIETNVVGSDTATSTAVGPITVFSPDDLFAASEVGVWYEPSPETTFTDTAGTTPATVGDAVALMLDKSQGLTLGPELVTNGTFDTDTDWTKGTGWAISGGVAIHTGGSAGYISQSGLVAGRRYRLTFTVTEAVGRTLSLVGAFYTSAGALNTVATSAGTFTVDIVPSGGTLWLYANSSGTTISLDNISVRELPGYHATQATAASRPTLRQSGDLYYLEFDGVDDFMVTPTITPGTDKVQVFAGVRKLSDAASAILLESSVITDSNNGSFMVTAPGASGIHSYVFRSSGTSFIDALPGVIAIAPSTNVLTGIGDISGDIVRLRVDGTQVAQSTLDQGTGNYLAYPMYIGRRGGTSIPFSGHIYSLIARFGPNLDSNLINQSETYVADKTGVDL